MKNLLKNSATALSSEIIFSETISSLPSWEAAFFDKPYFRFCFYFVSKKRVYCLPKGFVSVMSLVLLYSHY